MKTKEKKTRDTIIYLIYLFGIVYEDLNGNKHAFFSQNVHLNLPPPPPPFLTIKWICHCIRSLITEQVVAMNQNIIVP